MSITPEKNDILTQEDIDAIIKEHCYSWQEPFQRRTTVFLIRGKVERFCEKGPSDDPSFLIKWTAEMISWITEYEQNFVFPHACHMKFDSWKEWLADRIDSALDTYTGLASEESGWETHIENLTKGRKVLDLRPFVVWDLARKIEDGLHEAVTDSLFDLLQGKDIDLTLHTEKAFNEAMEALCESFLS